MEPLHLPTETLTASCRRTAGKWFSRVPRITQMKPQPRAFSPIRAENPTEIGLAGGEGEIRTPETLWDSMCGIRPEFGTLFSSKKSIRAAENMFAGDSALIRISSVPFVHYAYARNPVTSNSRQRLEFESTHSWAGAQRQFCLFPSSRGGVRVGGDFSLCAAEHRTAAFRVLLGSAGPDPVRPQKTRL